MDDSFGSIATIRYFQKPSFFTGAIISELVANIASEQVAVFGRKTQNAADVTIQIQSPYVRRLHRLGTASVDELEHITGEKIPVADYAKHDKPNQSWMIPVGCNKG